MAKPQLPTIYRGGGLMQFTPPALEEPLYADALAVLTDPESDFETLHDSETATALDLMRVPMPKEATSPWVVPRQSFDKETGEVRDHTPMSVIDGVVFLRRPVRLFWADAYGGGGNKPPDCVSHDNINGIAQSDAGPGGKCADCPMAKFGTATDENGNPAAGQACSQRTELYVQVPWSLMPIVISAPPTSYTVLRQFAFNAPSLTGTAYHRSISRIEVEEATNSNGVAFPRIKVTALAMPPANEVNALAEVRAAFVQQFDDQVIEAVIPPDPEPDEPPAGEPGTTQNPGRAPTTTHPDDAALGEQLQAKGKAKFEAMVTKAVDAVDGEARGLWGNAIAEVFGRRPTSEEFQEVIKRANEREEQRRIAAAAGVATDDDPPVPQGGVGQHLPM